MLKIDIGRLAAITDNARQQNRYLCCRASGRGSALLCRLIKGELAGLPLLIFRKLVLISHVEILFEGIYCKPI